MNDPFVPTYARYPDTLVRGEGHRLQDSEGRWYLDACGGIAVMALGHGHPAVKAAVHAQVEALMHVSNLWNVPVQRAFAERLVEVYQAAGVFLANSGAEANEAAAKLARKAGFRKGELDRNEILTLEHAFHGRTLFTLSMTPKPAYQEGYGPLVPQVRSLPADAVAAAVSARTAAVFVEPVQGESGCHVVPQDVLVALRAACDRHGALLVYDEIQCGLGRTGELIHQPRPDLITLAKALGGGLPLSALVVVNPDLYATFQPGDHGSTFGGNPVSCAAGLATLDRIVGDDLPARCARQGARLRQGLEASGAAVTGLGLIQAAHLGRPAGPVVAAMRDRGVLVCPAGKDAVRFLPPFTITDNEIDEICATFADALAATA